MAKVEFTEVTTDSFVGNNLDKQEQDTTINKYELGISEGTNSDAVVHAYIVFTNDISIDEGIGTIEEKVCNGQTLKVTRRDDSGNAVVAVISQAEAKSIEQLSQVSSVKIDTGVETTNTDKKKDATNETVETENKTEEKTDEKVEAQETEETSNTDSQSVISNDITSETTTEVQDNNLDTSIKTGVTFPIVIAALLAVAILIGIIIKKTNR
ncbi:hypothetical protein SAMN04487831_101503 [Pseudobutyrivibrio sp. UC1225]|uniref:hypothetical protein n=1 Tax=Pseudobutyrivibrio sp. UC1225 TaxID=1798185 RepID=UPI0008F13A56|nr:hypothetical protein [Pseudobutyrivibrio sp. UC1225]SFN51451.1 hypothetical protein SAMN04487831_101503 [Pseudobutyrivibrio sp. UC1225]